MSQALYRTYRSRGLSEVVGQEHITVTLARAIQAGHISHAYLFTGPRGTGKTSVARILAHEINGLPYSDTPNLDIIEIDAASNRRIDDIRDLREKVHIAPVAAKYKVYIIDEVHMLTGESFNALLKTLEEPPSHVVFILATTEVHKLPATIISRVQRFAFKPGDTQTVTAHLKHIAQKEKIDIEDSALRIIAEHGEGSYRDSLSLLDQLTHISSGTITAADVARTLGLAPEEQIKQIIDGLLTHDLTTALNAVKTAQEQGSSPATLVEQLTQALLPQTVAHPELFVLIDRLLEVPRAYNPNLKLISTIALFKATPTQTAKKTAAVSIAPPAAVTIASAPQTTTKAAVVPTPNVDNNTTISETPLSAVPHQPAEPLSQLSAQDWNSVMSYVKQTNAPLFAMLKQAQPVLQGDNTLLLQFKFSLMAKKIDDPKQKSTVADALQKAIGRTATITVTIDKNAQPPVFTDNPHVTSVTAIMGGGEVINAETI